MCIRDSGSEERFPHLVTDRAKPGVIAVNQRAVRFVNESSSYHHFASAMPVSYTHLDVYKRQAVWCSVASPV